MYCDAGGNLLKACERGGREMAFEGRGMVVALTAGCDGYAAETALTKKFAMVVLLALLRGPMCIACRSCRAGAAIFVMYVGCVACNYDWPCQLRRRSPQL